MTTLSSSYTLKNNNIRNRIVFPPIVCFHYAGDDGMVTDRNVAHYREIASGGPGIVITEATAVDPDGRLAPFQLGIWSDLQITGMARIATAVKEAGALSLLQIHTAGLLTSEKVSDVARAPSVDPANPRSRELSAQEIDAIRDAFIAAARRARLAGFQGVELHGAHGYLLNQFASGLFNRRTDEYGGDIRNRMRLAVSIVKGIREICGDEFIIGYRLGANTPSLEDGVEAARILENAGVDLLHVSHGGSLQNLPRTPKDFEFNWIVYSGTVIRSQVDIPVIVVNEIRTAERAEWLISNGKTDFVAIGRPQMSDPAWALHILNGEQVNECFSCRPKCRWYENSDLCPARKRLGDKQQA